MDWLKVDDLAEDLRRRLERGKRRDVPDVLRPMRQIHALTIALVMAGLAAAACNPQRSTPATEPTRASSQVSSASARATTAEGPGGVTFDNRLELVSFHLSSTTLRPGDGLEVTVRWRSLAPIAADLRAFAELTDPAGEEIAGDTDVIGTRAHATSTWAINEEGQHILRLDMPARIPAGPAELRVGVLDTDETTRLPVSFPGSVPGGPTWTTLAVFASD